MIDIEWDNSLSVGNDEIDRQHQMWLKILNRTHERIMTGKAHGMLQIGQDTLKEMKEYCAMHFEFEEKYMAQINFEDTRRHTQRHVAFLERLNQIETELRQNPHALVTELFRTMGNWLINHIMNEDMQIGFAQLPVSRPSLPQSATH
ncbi:MAG: hemerythrin family protein [Deltaproteobacteria bacterium]|nr:hemerythrin family protein [Deltaproteobacteria bacterium]